MKTQSLEMKVSSTIFDMISVTGGIAGEAFSTVGHIL